MCQTVLFYLNVHNTLSFEHYQGYEGAARVLSRIRTCQGFQNPSRHNLLGPFYCENEIKNTKKERSMYCKCTATGGTSLRFRMECVKVHVSAQEAIKKGLLTSLSFSSSASVLSTSLWSSSICSTFSRCSSSYTHTHEQRQLKVRCTGRKDFVKSVKWMPLHNAYHTFEMIH